MLSQLDFQCGANLTFNVEPISPFVPSVLNIVRLTKILIKEGIVKKISYECLAYESVDEKSLS